MKQVITVLVISLTFGVFDVIAASAETTLDFILPETESEVRDILPPPSTAQDQFGFRKQAIAGVCSYKIPKNGKAVCYNAIGFGKRSYRPFTETITRDRILAVEETKIKSGQTVFFYNQSAKKKDDRPLLKIETDPSSPDPLPIDFGQTAATEPSGTDPAYQYTFITAGTYLYRNALKPYQRGKIIVEPITKQKSSKAQKKSTTTKKPSVKWLSPTITPNQNAK